MMRNDNEAVSRPARPNPYLIASAYRTLQVLQAFAGPPHRFGLSELVERLGLEKNQLYRSLKTLEAAGYLRVADDGRYELTPLLNHLSTAAAASRQANLADLAAPLLDELAETTGETVNLFVRAGDLAVCIDRRDSRHQVKLSSVLGRAVPLHAGAVPKAILAFLPEEERADVLANASALPRYTDKTLTDPDRLEAELGRIRAQGYSVSDEDYDAAARGVGAPIFDAQGAVVAGVSVGGPSFRVDDAALARFSQLITQVARAVSQRLGHLG